jgi:hypothetical protein
MIDHRALIIAPPSTPVPLLLTAAGERVREKETPV